MQTVWERANAGAYKPSGDYPARPIEPGVLRKSAGLLTAEEIAELPAIREAYDAAKTAQHGAQKAYNEEQGRLFARFKADLEEEHGMTGHPKADLLFEKAWDRGHSNGYAEVAMVYDDLVELVK